MQAPLEGIKVVEWSMYATGPLAGVMLSDLGADVIKIEDGTTGGDRTRGMRFVGGGMDCLMPGDRNAWFEVMNWNKRSVTLNLKHPEGREVALRLLDAADVFILNFRPGVVRRLGLDYDTVAKRNPRIVYVSASSYGERGPLAQRAGNDYTGQARSGMMWPSGDDAETPRPNSGAPVDMASATLLTNAVVTALLARERYGEGQKVELSNLAAGMWIEYYASAITLLTGRPWPHADRSQPGNPLFNHYRCGDGRWLVLANLLPENWPVFCRIVGLNQLLDDPRFSDVDRRRIHAAELTCLLEAHFLTRPRDQWEALLERDPSMTFESIQSLSDLADDPQVLANEYVVPMEHPVYGRVNVQPYPARFTRTPAKPRRAAPELGAHNLDVLVNELGYTPEQVGELIAAGALT